MTNREGRKKRVKRVLDFSEHCHRPIALKVAYLGWVFHGFASQVQTTEPGRQTRHVEGGKSKLVEKELDTIEKHLFTALIKSKLVESRESCGYARCGRTDKGVSAFSQVVSLYVRTNFSKNEAAFSHKWAPIVRVDCPVIDRTKGFDMDQMEDETMDNHGSAMSGDPSQSRAELKPKAKVELEYVNILNRLLPSYIRVLAWAPTDSIFSARFSCCSRSYKYYIPSNGLDIAAMSEAAGYLVGEHDFRMFAKIDKSKDMNYSRRVISATVQAVTNVFADEAAAVHGPSTQPLISNPIGFHVFTIRATAFLWHQIRLIVHVLILVGQGHERPTVIRDLLDMNLHKSGVIEGREEQHILGRPAYDMASELGLVLWSCDFPHLRWSSSEEITDQILIGLKKLFQEHLSKTLLFARLMSDLLPTSSFSSIPQIQNLELLGYSGPMKSFKSIGERQRCEGVDSATERRNNKVKGLADVAENSGSTKRGVEMENSFEIQRTNIVKKTKTLLGSDD